MTEDTGTRYRGHLALEEQMGFFYISDELAFGGGEDGGEVAVVVAGGEIDYAASPQLKARIAEHVEAGRRRLVLDLSTVTFIDSTAIGVLMGAVMRLDELGGGSVAVVCAEENKRVLRIFEIVGIDSLLELHSSREEAISALATAG
jgi:anti-sigma B factor antagonist